MNCCNFWKSPPKVIYIEDISLDEPGEEQSRFIDDKEEEEFTEEVSLGEESWSE